MNNYKSLFNKKNIIIIALLIIALFIPSFANRRVLNIAILTLMYVTLGQSWNLLSGMAGIFSITHALFFGLGAYSMTLGTNRFGLHPIFGFVIGLVVNTLMASLVGYIGSKLSGLYFTMALIALNQTVFSIFIQWSDLTGGYMGISMPREYLLSKQSQYYVILLLAVFAIAFFAFIRSSRVGTNFIALKENPDLANALGSNIGFWRVFAAILSASIASLAGGFYSFYMMATTPDVFSGNISLKIIMVTMVGGMGSTWGPVAGSFMIVLDEVIRGMMPSKYAPFSVVIYASVLIAVALLRPKGITSFFTKSPAKKDGSLAEDTSALKHRL